MVSSFDLIIVAVVAALAALVCFTFTSDAFAQWVDTKRFGETHKVQCPPTQCSEQKKSKKNKKATPAQTKESEPTRYYFASVDELEQITTSKNTIMNADIIVANSDQIEAIITGFNLNHYKIKRTMGECGVELNEQVPDAFTALKKPIYLYQMPPGWLKSDKLATTERFYLSMCIPVSRLRIDNAFEYLRSLAVTMNDYSKIVSKMSTPILKPSSAVQRTIYIPIDPRNPPNRFESNDMPIHVSNIEMFDCLCKSDYPMSICFDYAAHRGLQLPCGFTRMILVAQKDMSVMRPDNVSEEEYKTYCDARRELYKVLPLLTVDN